MTGTSFYICPAVFSSLHVSGMFVCRKLVLNTNHVQAESVAGSDTCLGYA